MWGQVFTVWVVLFLAGGCAHTDLRMVVLFADPQGLTVGNDVRLDDRRIGEVLAVGRDNGEVAVEIRVDHRNREQVTSDADFSIRRVGLLSGQKYLQVTSGNAGPVSNGDRVRGRDPLLQRAATWAKGVLDFLRSPQLRDKVEAFSESVSEAAGRGAEAFEEARPGLEAKAKELIEMAREDGPEAAQRLSEALDKLLANIDAHADD